jgi:GxxExxY protein
MHAEHADAARTNELSRRIIGCVFTVLNTLGAGFLEKGYENALAHELRKAGLAVVRQRAVITTYDGIDVGQYIVDLMVEDTVLIELKTVRAFEDVHVLQCLNYFKATGLKLGLLPQFAKPRLEIKRIVHGLQ